MRTAIVTGVSSGIGESFARLLIENGWKVYGVSRRKPTLSNANFVWLECDLSKTNSIGKASSKISETSIELVYSNAGIAIEGSATDVTPESYEETYSVNVLAAIQLIHSLGVKITNATIISVSSVSDRIPEKDFALYCSSKAANTMFFNCLAQDLPKARVFTLLPDYVDTPMHRNFQKDGKAIPSAMNAEDLAQLSLDLVDGTRKLESGSNVIVVNNALKDDLKSVEQLYGFNTDTGELSKIN